MTTIPNLIQKKIKKNGCSMDLYETILNINEKDFIVSSLKHILEEGYKKNSSYVKNYLYKNINIEDHEINRLDITYDELIEDFLYIFNKSNSGSYTAKISPIVFKQEIIFSKLLVSFIKIGEKILLLAKTDTDTYTNINKSEARFNLFTLNRLIEIESIVAEIVKHGNSSKFKEFFKNIEWLPEECLNSILESKFIKVIECHNSYFIMTCESDSGTPENIVTPFGNFKRNMWVGSIWPHQNMSIRDSMVEILGSQNWNISLRSKKNRELFGRPLKELDWNNEDFVNLFTAIVFGSSENK